MKARWNLFAYFLVLALGVWLGIALQSRRRINQGLLSKWEWMQQLIQAHYVDAIPRDSLEVSALQPLLSGLDPFSSYLPPVEKQAAEEALEGNFEGIGVEFNLQQDSIRVVSALPGGPSDAAGIRSGDRIVTVNDKPVPGKGLTNEWVLKRLRGPRGTKVRLGLYRPSWNKVFHCVVTRDKIALKSVDLAWWPAPGVAHVRINKFGAQTHRECVEALRTLQNQSPIRRLILDLRGNPGGYLESAVELADEFLPGRVLITYTQGEHQPRRDYYTQREGLFEKGTLLVLLDQGSASASEILAGALNDHDRATLIGERTFGKALVQQQFEYQDGSAVRLTVARYYTPRGVCIQKPYQLQHGDSPSVRDSGGIAPDLRVASAYAGYSPALTLLMESGLLYEEALRFAETPEAQALKQGGQDAYFRQFRWAEPQIRRWVQRTLLSPERSTPAATAPNDLQAKLGPSELDALALTYKAQLGRLLFGNALYFKVMAAADPVVAAAVQWKARP